MTLLAEAPADQEEPAVQLPSLPDEPPPNGFPVLMTVAPVVVSLILFALLRTPYVLMFAILGPVLGTANVIDQRLGRKRRRKRAQAQFEEDAAKARVEIARAHRRILARKRAAHPLAIDLANGARRVEPGIVVGTTIAKSGLRLDGAGSDAQSRELAELASRLHGVPITVEGRGICVSGPRVEVTGALRALVVQLLTENPAALISITGERSQTVVVELQRAGMRLVKPELAEIYICAHSASAEAKASCAADDEAIGIAIETGGSAVLTESSGRVTKIIADSLGAAMLLSWLPNVVAAQRARANSTGTLPIACDLGDLTPATEGQLAAHFLLATEGPCRIDLVGDGPHALIGGTTGSGKSELLIAWTAALASSYTSDECNLLCIDFKGGATFDAVTALPHCVGVVTDLDDDEALRVGASLRAEMRRREFALRDLRVRDIADLKPGILPRLVVMVDEFQALLEAHPDLQDVFGDLGARGRSLGIHLVLCTQRPTGAFRESLLANAAIRICLRVEQPSDSMTLLGCADGSKIDRELRGRALVTLGNDPAVEVQGAIARPELIAELAKREQTRRQTDALQPVRKPWLPALPEELPIANISELGRPQTIPFALGDLPEKQQQPIVSLERPGQHIFVIGMAESGKSTVIETIGEAALARGIRVCTIGGHGVEHAWDSLESLLRTPPREWTVVLLDDLDLLEQQLDEEHRAEWVDRLQRLLRTGTRLNLSAVLTARRSSGSLQRIRSLCDDTLYLAAPSRQEWILQGADASDWADHLPPGRGRLGKLLIQVAKTTGSSGAGSGDSAHSREPVAGDSVMGVPVTGSLADTQWQPFRVPAAGLVVTGRRLAPVRQALMALGYSVGAVPSAAAVRSGELELELGGTVILGDTDQWNAAYGTLPKFAEHVPVLLVGVTPGEWRSTFRGDPLYPALEEPFNRALLRLPNGAVERVELLDGSPVRVQTCARSAR
ncbi:FtsK/SpoIIIE domain-containing protein [Gulosibacter chungangensis]|uniref:FtsK domain-containing protein n=1 Tax=Gulosibacter chungangensis TaxID=979746 RepID=A0A7J5BE78_9MICO|nr:FtsK/SpoIIIE domain-containing protein [Gulosibacter chungangensis]KAB1643588.1 hypothetical protein F8O05_06855 [Gulosibacter chungangensis]